jgi:hypothetical protein
VIGEPHPLCVSVWPRRTTAMGAPGASAHWQQQRAKFLKQIKRHALKSDYAVVDVTGFTKAQIQEIMHHISTLSRRVQHRIIVINDTKILN